MHWTLQKYRLVQQRLRAVGCVDRPILLGRGQDLNPACLPPCQYLVHPDLKLCLGDYGPKGCYSSQLNTLTFSFTAQSLNWIPNILWSRCHTR